LMHITTLPSLFPFILICTFFFTDLTNSNASFLLALKNGLKTCAYFLPIIAIFFGVYLLALVISCPLDSYVHAEIIHSYTLGTLYKKIFSMGLIPLGWTLLTIFFKFLYIASLGIYYITIKHQYHSLFFKEQG
ncbi:MAG: hypothetical protein V1855_00940, partial [bacterium]